MKLLLLLIPSALVLQGIAAQVTVPPKGTSDSASAHASQIKDGAAGLASDAGNAMYNAANSAATAASHAAEALSNSLSNAGDKVIVATGAVYQGAKNTVVGAAQSVSHTYHDAKDTVNRAGEAVANTADNAYQGAKNAVNSAGETVAEGAGAAYQGAANAAHHVGEKFEEGRDAARRTGASAAGYVAEKASETQHSLEKRSTGRATSHAQTTFDGAKAALNNAGDSDAVRDRLPRSAEPVDHITGAAPIIVDGRGKLFRNAAGEEIKDSTNIAKERLERSLWTAAKNSVKSAKYNVDRAGDDIKNSIRRVGRSTDSFYKKSRIPKDRDERGMFSKMKNAVKRKFKNAFRRMGRSTDSVSEKVEESKIETKKASRKEGDQVFEQFEAGRSRMTRAVEATGDAPMFAYPTGKDETSTTSSVKKDGAIPESGIHHYDLQKEGVTETTTTEFPPDLNIQLAGR